MAVSDVLRERTGRVEIDVIVSANAKTSAVVGLDAWRKRLMISVKTPPEKGRANKEVCEVLSDFFRADVKILKGQRSRLKTVLVGVDIASVVSRLEDFV